MRKKIFLSILLFLFLPFSGFSQCKEYIKTIAADELAPYVVDGNFFSPVIYEGESITLTRTFLAKQKYKIAVVGMNFFTKKITIKDQDGFILFMNYTKNRSNFNRFFSGDDKSEPQFFYNHNGDKIYCEGSNYWEFELDQSQNLTIIVSLEQRAKKKKDRLRGCLGIIIGFGE